MYTDREGESETEGRGERERQSIFRQRKIADRGAGEMQKDSLQPVLSFGATQIQHKPPTALTFTRVVCTSGKCAADRVALYVCSGSPGIHGVSHPLSHILSLSPLLPWQHIFCMEIASHAVPAAHKKREKALQ